MNRIDRIIGRLRAAATAFRDTNVRDIDFKSGLGDSAWILYSLVKAMKPMVCVEIGSARGKSTCFIGRALKENGRGKVFAIDPHEQTTWNDADSEHSYPILLDNIRRTGLANQVEVIRQNSTAVAERWHTPIDLLFIDGDHSYDGVKRDWNAFAPFVREFGLVIFHDTIWDLQSKHPLYRPDMGVPRFVEELRQQNFPVITLFEDFGVSLVQPVQEGIRLQSPIGAPVGAV